ncbi:hypothetical protein [Mycobacterium colombiense]|uniref:hypothetical protein n=1 Tax=Mycobacterium colombiense TaxID=339268 RepID=UPI003AF53A76
MTTTTNVSPNAVGEQRNRPGRFVRRRRSLKPYLRNRTATRYQLTDRLHGERTVYVSVDEIVTTISGWLAELGVDSPLVEDLAHAVRVGDWWKAYRLGDCLSVEVTGAQ